MPFPSHRMRRLRATEGLRTLVRETRLAPSQFILPLFACPGEGVRREIGSMPGNYQLAIDEMVKECAKAHALGIGGVILFGIPEKKDELASGADRKSTRLNSTHQIISYAVFCLKKQT